MKETDNKLDNLSAAVQAMSRCDPLTLAAALALLPDYMEQGTEVLIAATARVIAERVKDPKEATAYLEEAIRKNLEQISERKN